MLEFSYPRHKVNMISGLVQMYSTVGVLVPICRRKMLLNIWTASFLPSKSMRCRFLNKARIKPVLYISWLNWANTMSDCWSDSFPNKSCFMFVNCLERSSWAWKIHIKKKSKYDIVWSEKKCISDDGSSIFSSYFVQLFYQLNWKMGPALNYWKISVNTCRVCV